MASFSEIENMPYLPPPLGQMSNFVNPASRGPAIIGVCSTFIALMWPIFLLRIYSKIWVTRNFGWDDASTVLATVIYYLSHGWTRIGANCQKIGTTSYAAAVIWAMKIIGPHGWNVRVVALTEYFIQIEISVFPLVYGPTIFFAKLALFLLYLRIFSCSSRIRGAIYFGIIVNFLFYAAITILFGIQCVRRPGQSWFETTSSPRCIHSGRNGYAQGSFGIVSDLYIFILPMPVIWGLQMQLRKKVAVCATFLTGLIAIVASVLGCYYRVREAVSPDVTWNLPMNLGLGIVEMSTGVICGSVPHLSPLFRRYKPNLARVGSLFYLLFRSSYSGSKESSALPLQEIERGDSDPYSVHEGRIETKVLGSIEGDGKFLRSKKFSQMWGSRTYTAKSGSTTVSEPDVNATKREYHEIAKENNQT